MISKRIYGVNNKNKKKKKMKEGKEKGILYGERIGTVSMFCFINLFDGKDQQIGAKILLPCEGNGAFGECPQ
jgi:hypothetical protein